MAASKPSIIDGRQYVNTKMVSEATGLTEDWIRELSRQGTIPCRKIGSRWKYNVEDVFSAIQRSTPYALSSAKPQTKPGNELDELCEGI